jgi:hypothetical protein
MGKQSRSIIKEDERSFECTCRLKQKSRRAEEQKSRRAEGKSE